LLGIVALILFCGWAVGKLMPVVLPFAVAVLLATLLRPVAARLERRGCLVLW
jgi:predicted PurR-regulated permease PerM